MNAADLATASSAVGGRPPLRRWAMGAAVLGFLLACAAPIHVGADEIRPALLDIKEQSTGLFVVTWKVPTRGKAVLAIAPRLPSSLELLGAVSTEEVSGARIERGTYKNRGESLVGQTVAIDGLAALQTDVLLLVQLRDGVSHSAILRPSSPAFTVPLQPSSLEVAADYWRLGTVHILEGLDHLLFLLTLLLIVTGLWPVLKTVTAFTVAHSLTLALATLGVVNLPPAPTEAVISLSIMLLAVEVVRKNAGETTLSERFPWLVAFTFGLVHGLGFAGALSQVGVPQGEVPLALLMFNVGVETGQVVFVIGVSALLVGLHRVHGQTGQALARMSPYAIGGVAAFWTLQRVASFL